jgi:hypothetical protein
MNEKILEIPGDKAASERARRDIAPFPEDSLRRRRGETSGDSSRISGSGCFGGISLEKEWLDCPVLTQELGGSSAKTLNAVYARIRARSDPITCIPG